MAKSFLSQVPNDQHYPSSLEKGSTPTTDQDQENTGPKGGSNSSRAPHKALGKTTGRVAPAERREFYQPPSKKCESQSVEANARMKLHKQGDPDGKSNYGYDQSPAGEGLEAYDPQRHLDYSGVRDLHREASSNMLSQGHEKIPTSTRNSSVHRDAQRVVHSIDAVGSKSR